MTDLVALEVTIVDEFEGDMMEDMKERILKFERSDWKIEI